MTEPEREDWRKTIDALEAAGVSNYKLAQMLGRQLIQVQRWKAGSEPGHFMGERIRAIHREFCRRDVPRETLQPSKV